MTRQHVLIAILCHLIMLHGRTLPHARNATCNDCHVPNDNVAAHYAFKGMDGMKHVAYFVTFSESQSIQAESASGRGDNG